MNRAFTALSLSAVVALGGCAFTTAKLDVGYKEDSASRGPLASVESRQITIDPIVDKRPERDRIGYKKNGFGQRTADILSKKPVPDIVREALALEFAKNGHAVGDSRHDVIVSGEVTSFWFDTQINFWNVDFIGTAAVKLTVSDANTGTELLTRTYQGDYKDTAFGGLEGTWERVMNTALERMVREVATDPKLVQVLQTRRRPAEGPSVAGGIVPAGGIR